MNCFAAPTVVHYLIHSRSVSENCRAFLSDNTLNQVFGVPGQSYLWLFLLTCLLEFPIYFYFLRTRVPTTKLMFLLLFLNLATHPLVILGLPQFFALAEFPKIWAIVAGEIFAPFIEGLLLWQVVGVPPRQSWKSAIMANIFSWTVGGYLPL